MLCWNESSNGSRAYKSEISEEQLRTPILQLFRWRFRITIDSYHHLGIIENDLGHRGRGLKYFEMGYRIGLLSVPANFAGRLPWVRLENRPFLRAAHGYGLALEQKRRQLDAVEVYERILFWNPNDNQGIRYTSSQFISCCLRTAEGQNCIRKARDG